MIYTYKCKNCDLRFEYESKTRVDLNLEALGFDASPRCPKCDSIDTKKIIIPPTVIFRGAGFTKTIAED